MTKINLKQRRANAYNDYIQGMTQSEIAIKYNVSIETVKSWRKSGKWLERYLVFNEKVCKGAERVHELEKNKESELESIYLYRDLKKSTEDLKEDITKEYDKEKLIEKALLYIYLLNNDREFYIDNIYKCRGKI